ncbi:uncharacterized protein PAC_06497 [Phialocephala subalpina]|uniref:DUF7708 domain-containing protein n=1 Tax=Phialocephala subalpina TaxID=576137 RepID=A0A1L7WV16_9HELO|nr:uncharacterized protein PAC_06497 [Phialocephala subalpina]
MDRDILRTRAQSTAELRGDTAQLCLLGQHSEVPCSSLPRSWLEELAERAHERRRRPGLPLRRCVDAASAYASVLLEGHSNPPEPGMAACGILLLLLLQFGAVESPALGWRSGVSPHVHRADRRYFMMITNNPQPPLGQAGTFWVLLTMDPNIRQSNEFLFLMENPHDVIADAFKKLERSISEDDAHNFASTELKDVWSAVRDIDSKQRKRQSAQNLRRVEPLLRGIEKYTKVIEVLCNGTLYMPYVWAPIKLMLEIASHHRDVFEALLSAYADIGAALPRFDRYQTAFSNNREFQHALAAVYSGILDFHQRAYKFFRRRAWHVIFLSLWKDFRPRFDSIINSLKEQRDLLDKMSVAASSGVELRGEGDQEAELRRNQQRHLQPPIQVISAEPRPFHHFEVAEPEASINEAQTVRQKCKGCFIVYLLWGAVAVGSLVIGLWRSFITGDEGKGFTDAANTPESDNVDGRPRPAKRKRKRPSSPNNGPMHKKRKHHLEQRSPFENHSFLAMVLGRIIHRGKQKELDVDIIRATGALHGSGASIIRASSGSGSGSGSSASSAALLRFRPRFPLPFMTSFAARFARASSMSS